LEKKEKPIAIAERYTRSVKCEDSLKFYKALVSKLRCTTINI